LSIPPCVVVVADSWNLFCLQPTKYLYVHTYIIHFSQNKLESTLFLITAVKWTY
jgi:hypothetical protein